MFDICCSGVDENILTSKISQSTSSQTGWAISKKQKNLNNIIAFRFNPIYCILKLLVGIMIVYMYTDASDIDTSTCASALPLTEVQWAMNNVMQWLHNNRFKTAARTCMSGVCQINPRWNLPLWYGFSERVGVGGSQCQFGAFDALVLGVGGRWGGHWKCLLGWGGASVRGGG